VAFAPSDGDAQRTEVDHQTIERRVGEGRTREARGAHAPMAADRGWFACAFDCASVWPPLLRKNAPSVGAGLNSSLLGTTKRD
jgi:hypothetical protein